MKKLVFITLVLLAAGCNKNSVQNFQKLNQTMSYTYIPIGDSYTIGQGADESESWPKILTEHLNINAIKTELLANPSRTGWTSQDALNYELPLFEKSKPSFGTLLIGVNDYVQGIGSTGFENNLKIILDRMQKVMPDKSKLIIMTIPDFSVTSSGKSFARGRNVSEDIQKFNAIIIGEAKKRKLTAVDIFPVSQDMGKDSSLVAQDGLHPSAKEYAIWEKLIYPVAAELLK